MALRDKQAAFVNEYLIDYNATRAAERAGYKGDDATLASVGWENLRKPEIAKAIQERLQEANLTADEVLMRLGAQARGSMADFLDVPLEGPPTWNFQKALRDGKLGLIKKYKTKTTIYLRNAGTDYEEQVTEVVIDLELYDAKAANELIGKHHGLFKDGPSGSEDDPLHIKVDL